MSLAFLFPGQGSQYVGMGKEIHHHFDIARKSYEEASQILGWDVARLCFEGPEGQLHQTEYTQPAILVTSIAVWRSLYDAGKKAACVAGHSLGEYTALVAAGALSFPDAVRLVHLRGRFMQEAVPAGKGKMAAILGLSRRDVEDICRSISSASGSSESGVVAPANYNAPDQTVIAGESEAVARAMTRATEKGAKRAVPLSVSVPSHSPLMKEACIRLSGELDKVKGNDLTVPLINNLQARKIERWSDAKAGLIDQLSSPLLWEESIQTMRTMGADLFIEVGPGRVLSGLLKRIDRRIETMNAEDTGGIRTVSARIKTMGGA